MKESSWENSCYKLESYQNNKMKWNNITLLFIFTGDYKMAKNIKSWSVAILIYLFTVLRNFIEISYFTSFHFYVHCTKYVFIIHNILRCVNWWIKPDTTREPPKCLRMKFYKITYEAVLLLRLREASEWRFVQLSFPMGDINYSIFNFSLVKNFFSK